MFCHYCGMLGHDWRHCTTHFAMEKNGGKVEYQYGGWLKAGRGHQRSLPWQEVGKDFDSADDKEAIPEHVTNHQPEFGKLMVTMKSDAEKPSSSSYHDEGISEIPETVLDFQRSDKVTTGIHANVKSCIIVNSGTNIDIQQIDDVITNNTNGTLSSLMDEIKGDLNLNREAGIAPNSSNTNQASAPFGSILSKPKATWTRINRMDFGLSGFTKALNLPTLDKGDLATEDTVSLDVKQESLGVKRGKVDNEGVINVDESARVEIHPYREQ